MADAVTVVLMFAGAGFLLLASVAALRMPDVYCRLSASTKAVTFGATMVFVAAAVFYNGTPAMLRAIAGIVFFFSTSPIAAHILARASYARGTRMAPGSIIDEFEAAGSREEHPDPAQGTSAVPGEGAAKAGG